MTIMFICHNITARLSLSSHWGGAVHWELKQQPGHTVSCSQYGVWVEKIVPVLIDFSLRNREGFNEGKAELLDLWWSH